MTNKERIEILQRAIQAIDTIDDNEYDHLLDYTNAKPNNAANAIENLIDGLEQLSEDGIC